MRRLVLTLGLAACSRGATSTPVDAVAVDAPAAPWVDAPYVTSYFDVHTLANATICVVGQADCETANASGDARLGVVGPANDLAFAFATSAPGYLTSVELGHVFTQLDVFVHTVPDHVALLADSDAHDLVTAAGFAYPATTTGYLRLAVRDGVTLASQQGATVTIDGTALAPVYLDAAGRPDPTLTAVGPGGGVLFGGVPAGPFTLTVHAGTRACIVQAFGWYAPTESSSASGVIVAGALTDALELACYPTS